MTLQLDQRARQAVIHGPPRKLVDGAPPTVMANIARRVAEAPDALIRSFQADGTLREQTLRPTLAAVRRNRRPIAQPQGRPPEPDRLAAKRPSRLRSLVLGVAARGRDPDTVHRRRPLGHG